MVRKGTRIIFFYKFCSLKLSFRSRKILFCAFEILFSPQETKQYCRYLMGNKILFLREHRNVLNIRNKLKTRENWKSVKNYSEGKMNRM